MPRYLQSIKNSSMSDQFTSTTMSMKHTASSHYAARLLYLERMKMETLHVREQVDQKLREIDEAIEECHQFCEPSRTVWSRIASILSSFCTGVTRAFRAVICGGGAASTTEIPQIVIDASETTPLIPRRKITPTETFMKVVTVSDTPSRRRHNSLGCVTPALRLQLETDTPAAHNSSLTLSPAMRRVEPCEEWARMILSSGASAISSPPASAATPGHGPSPAQNLAPWSQQLLDSGFSEWTK